MARRAEACASPIAPEQCEHNELANSTQLPPRPDLEFNIRKKMCLCDRRRTVTPRRPYGSSGRLKHN